VSLVCHSTSVLGLIFPLTFCLRLATSEPSRTLGTHDVSLANGIRHRVYTLDIPFPDHRKDSRVVCGISSPSVRPHPCEWTLSVNALSRRPESLSVQQSCLSGTTTAPRSESVTHSGQQVPLKCFDMVYRLSAVFTIYIVHRWLYDSFTLSFLREGQRPSTTMGRKNKLDTST
jgi:hypothetical protein